MKARAAPLPPSVAVLQAAVKARVAELKDGMAEGARKIAEPFDGNQSEAMRVTGAQQQMLSAIQLGSWKGIDGLVTIATALGISLDAVSKLRKSDAVVPITREMAFVVGEAAEWASAVETARSKWVFEDWALRAAGGVPAASDTRRGHSRASA